MMKKIVYFLIIALFMSCTGSNLNLELQKIESPMDCISNSNWSWNDGVATTANSELGVLKFKSAVSGTLSFDYQYTKNMYSNGHLSVSIDEKRVYNTSNEGIQEEDGILHVVQNNINKNSIIEFRGRGVSVWSIKISNIDEEDNHWDF